MDYNAWFQCYSGCDERYDLREVVYHCRKCGGLLEVRHDLEAIKRRSPLYWMHLFERRYKTGTWPFGSSVWGKKEWVCPEVSDDNVVSMYEGSSNMFWAERFGKRIGLKDLWVKLCGNSHTGSFKDLGMTVLVSMVKQMISEGIKIRGVACASTGDTSAALAAYCAVAGIPAVVFLPQAKVSPAQLIQPIANGAITLSIDTDFDGCMALVREVCSKYDLYLANSMNSLRIEGQKTVSIEMAQQFDWQVPDWVIIPGGNLGNVSALGKGFLEMKEVGLIDRLPRICCVQASKADPFYRSYQTGFKEYRPVKAGQTLATAIQIGNPVSIDKAVDTIKAFDGIVESATESELADAAASADLTGLYNCPHTGVALAGLIKLVEAGEIKQKDRVIVVSTAHGLKFTDFKIKYHTDDLAGIKPKYTNLPIEVAEDEGAVVEAIERKLAERQQADG